MGHPRKYLKPRIVNKDQGPGILALATLIEKQYYFVY